MNQNIWILATYDVVGHLRYRRSVTTTSQVTPTISYVTSYLRHRMYDIQEKNLRHRRYDIVGYLSIVL
jgi:hypothetical protein